MKRIALLSTLSIAMLASFSAQAAGAGLEIAGFVTPTACAPAFTGDGIVSYGKIPRSNLSAIDMTVLEEKTISFSLTCDSATKMAVKLNDNKRSSVVAGAAQKINSSLTDSALFGLDTDHGKKLGAYAVKLTNVTGDGAKPAYIYTKKVNSADAWSATTSFAKGSYFNEDLKAWGDDSAYEPAAYKVVTGDLTIQTVLDSTANLPAGDTIPLKGSSTMEIVYL